MDNPAIAGCREAVIPRPVFMEPQFTITTLTVYFRELPDRRFDFCAATGKQFPPFIVCTHRNTQTSRRAVSWEITFPAGKCG